MKKITVGVSMHRPETLKSTIRRMHQHDAIFLEDPPTPGFHQMLGKQQSIEKYLLETDTEYPRFTEMYCKYLRRLYDAGKSIFQVEPYLNLLIGIHERFAAGGSPDDIDPKSSWYPVYQAEKKATGLLLGYYRIAMVGSFEKTVKSVKKFAQADAARFVLRDSLRANALLSSMRPFSLVYIEAGDMHQYLFTRLKTLKNENVHIVRCYPMESAMRSLTGKRYLYGPGDSLTDLFQVRFAEQGTDAHTDGYPALF